jgi:hypothetical protein
MPDMSSDELRNYLQQIAYFTQTRGSGRPTTVYNGIKAVVIVACFYFVIMSCVWLIGAFHRPQPRSFVAHRQMQRKATSHAYSGSR